MPVFNAGDRITAAKLAQLEMATQMTNSASQSLVNNTFTKLDLDTTEFDTHGQAFPLGGRIVLAESGLWMLWGSIDYDGNATGRREVCITANGSGAVWIAQGVSSSSSIDGRVAVSGGYVGAAGDVIELNGRQTSGASLGVSVSGWAPKLGVKLLSKA